MIQSLLGKLTGGGSGGLDISTITSLLVGGPGGAGLDISTITSLLGGGAGAGGLDPSALKVLLGGMDATQLQALLGKLSP